MPVRVELRLAPVALADALAEAPVAGGLVQIASVGLRVDGPVPPRLAAVASPYSADGGSGLLFADRRQLEEAAGAAGAAGLPMHLMVHGDRALATAVDAVAAAGVSTLLIGLDVAVDAAGTTLSQLGARAAIAPARFADDVYWLDRVLTPEQAVRAHRWADLVDAGIPLVYASDAPAHPMRPLAAVATAMTRQNPDGYPAGGWHADQALAQSTAVRVMAGGEASESVLRPGAVADLIIWSEDPLQADTQGLLRGQVLMTIVAGRVAYSRPLVELPMTTERSR